MNLKYYQKERMIFSDVASLQISNEEAIAIFDRLKGLYRFKQVLKIRGAEWRQSGNCNIIRIRVSNKPYLRHLVHEVCHAIQFKKRIDKGIALSGSSKRWHTKEHAKLMTKLMKLVMDNREQWTTGRPKLSIPSCAVDLNSDAGKIVKEAIEK